MDSKTEPASEAKELIKGKFYWIKIKQWDDGSQHAIRIEDKWSVAQWHGDSFEELNEMYRIQDVVEIGQCIPSNEEITSLKAELERERELRKELINDLNDIWENYDHHPLVDEKLEVLLMKTKNFKNGTTAR